MTEVVLLPHDPQTKEEGPQAGARKGLEREGSRGQIAGREIGKGGRGKGKGDLERDFVLQCFR